MGVFVAQHKGQAEEDLIDDLLSDTGKRFPVAVTRGFYRRPNLNPVVTAGETEPSGLGSHALALSARPVFVQKQIFVQLKE